MMDVKAMAKSKRSHSQHHANKSYTKPTAKASATAAAAANSQGNSKRPSGKNVVVKPSQSRPRGSELPSNSDRYLDEDDLETMDGASLHHAADVVKPKSKGADYRYLISEARSQTHSTDCMDVYSSLDDILLPDLNRGFGDVLSVRGEAILSWSAADSFTVEDKARPGNEASFLSLNLNNLNEQLAKVDLAERLFIEPDVLPPELRSEKYELKDDGKDSFQKSAENKASEKDPAMTEDEIVLKEVAFTSSEVCDNNDGHVNEACLSGLELENQVKDNILPDSSKRLPVFEASQAEAELDMLLDSVGGRDVLKSFLATDQRSSTVGLDDALDDLLSSNSGMVKTAYSKEDAADNLLSSTSNMTKTAPSLDDGIDDLLDTTSYMTIQDNTPKSGNKAETLAETSKNSASSSKSKVVDKDDFDSWLESLS